MAASINKVLVILSKFGAGQHSDRFKSSACSPTWPICPFLATIMKQAELKAPCRRGEDSGSLTARAPESATPVGVIPRLGRAVRPGPETRRVRRAKDRGSLLPRQVMFAPLTAAVGPGPATTMVRCCGGSLVWLRRRVHRGRAGGAVAVGGGDARCMPCLVRPGVVRAGPPVSRGRSGSRG